MVYTDHSACLSLLNTPRPSGKLARWAMTVQEMNLTLKHCSGRQNANADALSRNPPSEEEKRTGDDDPCDDFVFCNDHIMCSTGVVRSAARSVGASNAISVSRGSHAGDNSCPTDDAEVTVCDTSAGDAGCPGDQDTDVKLKKSLSEIREL